MKRERGRGLGRGTGSQQCQKGPNSRQRPRAFETFTVRTYWSDFFLYEFVLKGNYSRIFAWRRTKKSEIKKNGSLLWGWKRLLIFFSDTMTCGDIFYVMPRYLCFFAFFLSSFFSLLAVLLRITNSIVVAGKIMRKKIICTVELNLLVITWYFFGFLLTFF